MTEARLATKDDLAAVTKTLAAAFEADPLMSWVMPDDASRRSKLEVMLGGLAYGVYFPAGGCWVTEGIGSVALWRPPIKHEDLPVEAPPPDVPPDENREPTAMEKALTPEELGRLDILSAAMLAQHPKNEHWYLNVLGTDPAQQSKGLGGAVVAPILALCDREGIPAYLESSNPRNIPFYGRQGFEQSGEIPLPDGPSLWPMWREPRG